MNLTPEQFQNLGISGVSALFGVIAGILGKGVPQKWSDDRKLKQDRIRTSEKDRHQARILRAVIRSEFRSIVNAFEEEIVFATCLENTYTWVPTVGYLKALQSDLNVLGSLSAKEAELIMDAVYVYRARVWYIRKNAGQASVGPVAAPDEPIGYDLAAGNNRNILIGDLKAIVAASRKAGGAIDL
jgi:hypothetical protein